MSDYEVNHPENQDNSEQQIESMVRNYTDGKETDQVIEFLKNHPEHISEFCMQIQDTYAITDRRTPVIILGELIKEILK